MEDNTLNAIGVSALAITVTTLALLFAQSVQLEYNRNAEVAKSCIAAGGTMHRGDCLQLKVILENVGE